MRHRRPAVTNNRKYERVPTKLRCWCEGENVTVYARIGNMSEGGLFVRTSTPLERGATARLRFGTDGFETTARVVWSRSEGQDGPAGMGLEFDGADDQIRAAIRRMIDEDRRLTAH